MKTNFKKIAILAGATAAMAAGSMSAHAVITSVPAPAQLIPLFYFNNTTANTVNTTVRITVPKSVGSDTVINLLGGTQAVGTSYSNSIQTGIAKLHYYVMSVTSKEVYDGSISVTADDEYFLTPTGTEFSNGGLISGTPYYLILTNETAVNGGAPTFSFAAEAWLSIGTLSNAALPESTQIPVLGLADTADTTTYPTPTNNVIEQFSSAQGGPVASPIISGIRLSTTTAGYPYRVVDVPFVGVNAIGQSTNNYYNTLIAWNDRNGMTGRLLSLSSDEAQQSLGSFSLPNQLNIVKLGTYNGASLVNVLGITDSYATQISNIGTAGTNCAAASSTTGCVNGNGFLKLIIDADTLPSGTLAAGAYNAAIMFNIPAAVTESILTPEVDSLIAIDTGFFTSN